jgi:hypothetical protein
MDIGGVGTANRRPDRPYFFFFVDRSYAMEFTTTATHKKEYAEAAVTRMSKKKGGVEVDENGGGGAEQSRGGFLRCP